ncbi:zinc metalloproteinase nas-6-like [Mytilus trossulus]|uniref:zinc metalloproteinase nas-6-like n=1 Tax=Mytilus trossulus TaxID=6551 RepID=UPI0030077946
MKTMFELIFAVLCLCSVYIHSRPTDSEDPSYPGELKDDPTIHEQNIGINVKCLTEGDIVRKGCKTRQSVNNYQQTWTVNKIPYVFIQNNYTAEERNFILTTFERVVSLTGRCIIFTPRTTEKDYIYIAKAGGCYSEVGRIGGPQVLSIDVHCFRYHTTMFNGTILHEIMHTLGFWHEHTRPDRDQYIKVNYDNVEQAHHFDYEKMDITETGLNDKKYDYYSIMHYSTRTFAKDRQKPTFEPTQHVDMHDIGQRKYLSDVDIKGIQQLYQCGKPKVCAEPVIHIYGYPVVKLKNFPITGSKVRYSCKNHYTLVGSPERFCRNDAKWSGDDPYCLGSSATNIYCNFDKDNCQWASDSVNNRYQYGIWIRHSGTTDTDQTGPVFDHTWETSDGYYMYVESSQNRGKKFRMRLFDVPAGICMSFYIHKYGKGIVPGSLRVFASQNRGTREKKIWQDNEISSTEWKRQLILSGITGPYGLREKMDIIFEAEVGTSTYYWDSDMAVDDIVIATCGQIKDYDSWLERQSKTTKTIVKIARFT